MKLAIVFWGCAKQCLVWQLLEWKTSTIKICPDQSHYRTWYCGQLCRRSLKRTTVLSVVAPCYFICISNLNRIVVRHTRRKYNFRTAVTESSFIHSFSYQLFLSGRSRCSSSWTVVPKLGYICLSEEVQLRLAIEGENIFVYYLFPNIYTHISEYYFQKYHYMLIVKCIKFETLDRSLPLWF